MGEGIISADEPLPVPPGGFNGLLHVADSIPYSFGFRIQPLGLADFGIFPAVQHEHTTDEHRFCHGALGGTGGLEALPRLLAEAVQVQAVVPVGTANQGQTVGTGVGHGEAYAAAQMLHQGHFRAGDIVEGGGVIQDGKVPGLRQIGMGGSHQPQGVVIKARANVVVAPLGQGLVLVIGRAVRPLDGGNVDDSLPGTVGCHVDEAQQILAAVPEAHAPPGAGFKIAGGAAHVIGDHALVLMPDVHRPVQLFVLAGQGVGAQQTAPVGAQRLHGLFHRFIGGKFLHHPMGGILADNAGGDEFLLPGIFAVTQHKHQMPGLAGGKGNVQVQTRHGCAAVGDEIAGFFIQNGLGGCKIAEGAQKAVPVGVEAAEGGVDTVIGVMVPAFPVFGFVVNDTALHLHFADV